MLQPAEKLVRFLRRQIGSRICNKCLVEALGIESISTVNEITRGLIKESRDFQRSPKERCTKCGLLRSCMIYGG